MDVRRQVRRRITLELLSLTIPIGAAFLFSGLLVADWSPPLSAGVALASAFVLSAGWLWHRRRVPATIDPWQTDDDEPDAEDDDGRWDWFTLLLLGVSLVGLVVVGVLTFFLVPLLVIVGFAVGTEGAGWGEATAAGVATLAVALVLEVAVVLPLSRRWDLSVDGPRSADPESDARPT